MNIKDSYLHGGTHVVKNINFSIAASGTNLNKLVATITWAEEGSSNTELAIPISGATFGSLTKNTVFAAPNGSNGVPSFRTLVAADIPNISANKITSDTLGAARLPLATNSAKGAVILGVAKTSDADSAITGKKYWVKMNANGKLFIDVPWNDNTHYTAVPILGGTNATSNATSDTANNATYLNIIENSAKSGGIKITGSGATTVKANGGILTINSTNTWKAANSSQEGYVPKLVSGGTALSNSTNDYILAFTYADGTLTPSWKKLPANAYLNNTYTVNNATYSIKSKIGDTTTTLSDFTANQSSADDFTLIQGSNITFTNDATNRTLTIAGTPNTTYKLTLNGTVKGTTGGTDLGTFYAIATSNASAANLVWMRNSANDAYAWRTLGSRAFDSTSYIPLAGSSTTSPITGTLYIKDADGIYISSNNLDKNIWHVVGNSGSWSSLHGFNLQYLGTGNGNNNDLVLWAHALSSTHVEVYRVHQDGSFIFKSTPKVGTTSVSLAGHKHAYTDLTGSTTTADQAIVSSGTANGWTLKTLGSRAFDSTSYLPLTGGDMTGSVYFSAALAAYNSEGIRFKNNDNESVRIGGDTGNGLGLYATGRIYLRPNVTLGTASTNGLIISSTELTYNGNTVYHSGNIPSNSKDAAGIVPKGVASRVYMTDSTGAPSWTLYDTTVTLNSGKLVTSGAVYTAIANNVASAVQYLGTVASSSDMIALTSAGKGDFARVTTKFTFTDATGSSVTAHVGDVVYLTNDTPGTASNWIVAHTEIDTNTWTAASTSAAGYVPKLVTGGANLAAASTDYVLAYINGATTPVWRKLPANAYKDTWIAWTGATSSTAGTAGYMPGAAVADRTKFLRGDGTWVALSLTDHTHKVKINGAEKTIAAPGGTAVNLGNYVPLTGANYSTATDSNPFRFSREGTTALAMAVMVNDYRTLFLYTNDESSSSIVFQLINTDTENSDGSKASDRNVTISSSNSGISMSIGGSLVAHAGNIYNKAATIGSSLTTIATIAGVAITASLPTASRSGSTATAGIIIPTTSGTEKFLREDGTWVKPSYITNTDKTGIKLATVSGTKKTDGTVIITNSSTGLSIAGGTNKFSIGDGTNYIEVAVTPSITNNVTGSGTSGKLVKWNGTNTITDGPALSSSISSLSLTTKFLREDGTWAAPSYTTDTVRPIYSGGTPRFTSSLKTAINFVGAGATSVTFLAAGTEDGQSGSASYASIKISSNNDLVKFSAITANTEYYLPVRAKNTTDTAQLLYRTSIIVKDSTITATLSGNASTATNLNKASGTNRGYLYLSANTTTACTGVGSVAAAADIGIPYIGYASNANTYGIYKDLFYLSGTIKYIGNNIHSNKFACVKTKDSVTDDWTGSSTSGSQSGGGTTTYSAGDGISINNGTISTTRKEWYGTEAQFNSLSSLDNNTTYYIMAT